MNFGQALIQMFPTVNPSQYEILGNEDGTFTITKWLSDTPKPSVEDVINYWNSTGMLDYLRKQKKDELDSKCDETIMSGFSSTALGTSHTYSSVLVDEIWYNATINRFNVDATYTSVQWKTIDSGYLAHTKEQFTQVFIDGHTWGDNQIAKLNNLKSQVSAATTEAELDAIVW